MSQPQPEHCPLGGCTLRAFDDEPEEGTYGYEATCPRCQETAAELERLRAAHTKTRCRSLVLKSQWKRTGKALASVREEKAALERRAHVAEQELAALQERNQELRATAEDLERVLQQERQFVPADGVWLVTSSPGGRQMRCIDQLGTVPEPLALAAIEVRRDQLAAVVRECWQVYRERGGQSVNEVVDALVRALYVAAEETHAGEG